MIDKSKLGLLGPGEVSERLGIPASTLRRLSVQYAGKLSESARRVKGKRWYTEADILTLESIRTKKPVGLVVYQSQPSSLATLPVEIIQQFDTLAAQIAQQSSDIETLKTQVEQLAAALEAEHKKSRWEKFWGR